MNIGIYGLGYVGAVSCACFARMGHKIVGVDINQQKVDLINNGKSPIIEKDLDEYIKEGVEKGLISAQTNFQNVVKETQVSLICVGTPSRPTGEIDLSYIEKVVENIAQELRDHSEYHVVVIRSTVAPGTIKNCENRIQEITGKTPGKDFDVVSNPEFLREGTAIEDFWNPPYTIIGANSSKASDVIKSIYAEVDAPFYTIEREEAELIKYANNNFHAVKVAFANEIGNICKELNVDGSKVMEIVAKDTKLNLSSYYLKPGFAFGGSCLPKDVRGLSYKARELNLKVPLLSSLLESNQYQIERGLDLVYKSGKKNIGFLGFSFKANTDDLRESPIVSMIETLIGKGYSINVYDKNVYLSNLLGKNKEYLETHIPHISKLLNNNIDEVLENSDVIVIGNKSEEFEQVLTDLLEDKLVVDLVRINKNVKSSKSYQGICW